MKIKRIITTALRENCYILSDEKSKECAVIDPGEYKEEISEYIKNENLTLKYILVTHGHFDHIFGVADVKNKLGGKICIHTLDSICLNDAEASVALKLGIKMQEQGDADILLQDNSHLYLGENEIKVIHTPGHSMGGVVYAVDDVMFSGDTLFRLSYGRTDVYGGSIEELYKSIMKLFSFDTDYKIYPGHGEDTTLFYERKNNPIMRGFY